MNHEPNGSSLSNWDGGQADGRREHLTVSYHQSFSVSWTLPVIGGQPNQATSQLHRTPDLIQQSHGYSPQAQAYPYPVNTSGIGLFRGAIPFPFPTNMYQEPEFALQSVSSYGYSRSAPAAADYGRQPDSYDMFVNLHDTLPLHANYPSFIPSSSNATTFTPHTHMHPFQMTPGPVLGPASQLVVPHREPSRGSVPLWPAFVDSLRRKESINVETGKKQQSNLGRNKKRAQSSTGVREYFYDESADVVTLFVDLPVMEPRRSGFLISRNWDRSDQQQEPENGVLTYCLPVQTSLPSKGKRRRSGTDKLPKSKLAKISEDARRHSHKGEPVPQLSVVLGKQSAVTIKTEVEEDQKTMIDGRVC